MRNDTGLPRVLIVSASAGTGHVSAGNAMAEAFTADGYDRVVHVDVLDLAPRWVRTAYGGGFELMAARAPRVWRGVYEWSDGPDRDAARWGPLAHRLLFRSFRRLLLAEPWTFCLCTHFLPTQLAAGLPGHPPFALAVTDFALHRYWVQPRVREYFVASRDMVLQLHARLPLARALATGIPVGSAFAHPPHRAAARAALGIHAGHRVVTVIGGGLGIGVEDAVRATVDAGVPDTHIIAVCGRNNAARRRLLSLQLPPGVLAVHGFVDDIAGMIAASDVVVTKPGGLTCSEALALGRPLILSNAIPGHEEANVKYLTARGAALPAPAPAGIGVALRRLLLDRAAYADAAAAAAEVGAPWSARAVAAALTRHHSRAAA